MLGFHEPLPHSFPSAFPFCSVYILFLAGHGMFSLTSDLSHAAEVL